MSHGRINKIYGRSIFKVTITLILGIVYCKAIYIQMYSQCSFFVLLITVVCLQDRFLTTDLN